MEPLQEIWIQDGDSLTFTVDEPWFCLSRGVLIIKVELESGQTALLRQMGAESIWYHMMMEAGGLEKLEGSRWSLARDDDGNWHPPALEASR